ncbi:MAG: NAD+ synthase [Actinomycetota bacterium]|nr:NAD+ synthase [Actinomycetota bacterium]
MVRIALAQMNTTVGDISGNVAAIKHLMRRAQDEGAQVVAMPELAITGYPPEDLLLKRSFVARNRAALDEVAGASSDVIAVVGFVDRNGDKLYNAAAICQRGSIAAVYRKQLLPNYGVFDEDRYFTPGEGHVLIETAAGIIGVCVCEDAWSPVGPVTSQGDAGAQVVININASPFHKGKIGERAAMLGERARRARASIAYVNAVGGQDELVFDGGSVIIDPSGEVVARLPQFEEQLAVVDVPLGEPRGHDVATVRRISLTIPEGQGRTPASTISAELPPAEEVYRALVLSLREYVSKNGFEKIVVGLSGGIDSSLVAVLAADALRPDAVLGVAMPSEFSSTHSVQDAKALAANLGIEMLEIPIASIYRTYLGTLEGSFGASDMGLAEENLQARIRGNLLMAISNRYGHLVVATGNKSEMACGYATLYGDMAGGFALLKDVFKTEVYALARYRNSLGEVIPEGVLTKAPSAELRPDQKDSDSLPAYDVLDPILEAYIEDDASNDDIARSGTDRAIVERVVALVDRAEYKRRQAPPGPKVTTKAFGRDRRLPITNRWRESQAEGLPERSVGPAEGTQEPPA